MHTSTASMLHSRTNSSMMHVRFDYRASACLRSSIAAPLAAQRQQQRQRPRVSMRPLQSVDDGCTASTSSSTCNLASVNRRSVLASIAAAAAAAAALGAAAVSGGAPAIAAESAALVAPAASSDADDELAAQLPGEPPAEPDLPRAYTQNVRQLVKALREAIDAEQAGAKEFEVRRKADPAKDLARAFLRRWQDDPIVAGDPARAEVQAALSELGRHYQRNGPRSRLSDDVAAAVLARLDAAEAALPPEKKGLLGL